MKNKRKNGGRRYDQFVALEHLVRDDTSSRLAYLCRSQLNTLLRWMHSMRRNARVVASEKCWSGIEEKMREISRDVNENWLRIGHVSTTRGKIFSRSVPKIVMGEKSWKAWKVTRTS